MILSIFDNRANGLIKIVLGLNFRTFISAIKGGGKGHLYILRFKNQLGISSE